MPWNPRYLALNRRPTDPGIGPDDPTTPYFTPADLAELYGLEILADLSQGHRPGEPQRFLLSEPPTEKAN